MEKDFGDFEEAVATYNQGNFESPIFGHRNDLFISTINDKMKNYDLLKIIFHMQIATSLTFSPSHLLKVMPVVF